MAETLLRRFNQSKYLLLLFLPCLIYYILFRYLPMFGVIISFKDYNLFKGVFDSPWVGFKYYEMFFHSHDFFKLMRNTLLLGLYKLLFGFPAPILLALILNEVRHLFFKKFVQTISYLPHFISNVVVVSMVLMFLSPSGGIVNQVIETLGMDPVNFMSRPEFFRAIYVASEIWQHTGWETILYLAALSSIDPRLYEAAGMDGASRWKQTFHITLPGITPVIVILFILNIGSVLDISFEKVFLMYNPAIYETSDILSTFVYRTGLGQGNFSYAAAIDVFTGIIGLIFIYSANYISRKAGETSVW
ncbi:ABC transporter permease [Paenibacillus nasutitermitis]|uniref:Sugar ABC transporter permease n=1 Tax=Paenibacillus nasutitermitis TaxID=1652958 RepID=A0A917DZL5_9BACL|nr:ABC transporter permease subunit [Paenibacillus nasutitermitis]GGD85823.1 sugar ABC transporter permease [Paenibacillus nasutitermitis]